MRKLSTEKRATILGALVEGNSVNATARMVGVSKITVLRLLADAGTFCLAYHDEHVRGLECERIQCDEIWSFCYAKDKNLPASMRDQPGVGSVWTWTALDADTKLMVAYHVGSRDAACALDFMLDLAGRILNRPQLTTDGHGAYLPAVDEAFGGEVDYAMLIKLYGEPRKEDARYSPCDCVGTRQVPVKGFPDRRHVSTSYVERQNLTMRMSMRRFTRLTNGFSKKIENHRHAIALHYFYYNWVRKHETLKTTPAVAAALSNKPLTMMDLVRMIEVEEAQLGTRITDYLPADSK